MPEQEKITINMSAVDLGKIDLLVQESLYSNRTDFIRTAIRNQLDKHAVEIQNYVTRHNYGLGAYFYSKSDFDMCKQKGEKIAIKIVGLLHFPSDLTPELAREVVDSIEVRGIFSASAEVKAAMADRMK